MLLSKKNGTHSQMFTSLTKARAQSFGYNEELIIIIYATDDSTNMLQTSTFVTPARYVFT